MKLIDKYIIKKFLGTFFYAIALIIFIVIIFDISEKIDDFITGKAPLTAIIFDYYFNFIPYFINLFSPLFTFIAVVFFTSKMAADTEIVAILASGVSFRRLLFPYFLSATFLAVLSFFLINFVIPKANEKRFVFEDAYLRTHLKFNENNIHRQIGPGIFVYMSGYNNTDDVGYKFSLDKIENHQLTYRIMAESIRWDSIKSTWHLQNYAIRTFDGMKESFRNGNYLDTALAIQADDFGKKNVEIETLNYFELNKFIEDEKFKGKEDVVYSELEKHKRLVLPFETFVLTMIAVALASRKVRGGIGAHIGFGLLISFSYLLFMQISNTFATNAGMSPMLAVWLPTIIYFLLGIVLLKIAPK